MSEDKKNTEPDLPVPDPDIPDMYYKMVDEVEDYAIILLDVTGTVRIWNRGAQKIKQYTEAEAVGRNFSMFCLPEDRARKFPEKMLEQARTHGRAVLEGWGVRRDGTRFRVSIALAALHGEGGALIGFSKVTRDLTEKKLAEDKLQKNLLELETQNRELERFA